MHIVNAYTEPSFGSSLRTLVLMRTFSVKWSSFGPHWSTKSSFAVCPAGQAWLWRNCVDFCNGPAVGKPTLPCKGAGGQIPYKVCNFLSISGWWRGVKHHVKFLQGVPVPHQRGCGKVFCELCSFLSRSCCRTNAEKSAVGCWCVVL